MSAALRSEQGGYDAIVVGAGHSGLVGAWYLAKAGWKVLMLERRDMVGGTNVTEEIFPGYRGSSVSNSSHSLDPRIAGDMQLDKFGLRFTRPELGSLTIFSDGRAFVPWPDRARRRAEIEKFAKSPRDADGFYGVIDFFQRVARQMDISFYDDAPSLEEVASRFRTPEQKRQFNSVMFGSIADLLDEHLDSPELQAFFAGTAVATNLVGPRTPGSAYLLAQRPLYEESMRREGTHDTNELMLKNAAPLGGIGAVTAAMAESARALGVDILLNADVQHILTRDGRVRGVALADGREFETPRVLSNVNPRLTLTRLVDEKDLDPEFLGRARGMKMAGSSAKVHIAVKGTPRFACAQSAEENELFLQTNFRVAPSIDVLQNAYNEATLGRWARRPTVAVVIPSAVDPSLTPPGCHFISLSVRGVPYHLAQGTWDEQRDDLAAAVVETLAEHIPNLTDIIVDTHVYTPVDLERIFNLPEGNGAHGDIVPGQIFDARPLPECANNRTPLQGLYLCGVGTWPGNFMSGITGYNASHRMLDDAHQRGVN